MLREDLTKGQFLVGIFLELTMSAAAGEEDVQPGLESPDVVTKVRLKLMFRQHHCAHAQYSNTRWLPSQRTLPFKMGGGESECESSDDVALSTCPPNARGRLSCPTHVQWYTR